MSDGALKILKQDMVVREVSHDQQQPGTYPTVRVVLRGHMDATGGTGAEFSVTMEKAPRVGDTFTVFAIPGQIALTSDMFDSV